MTTLPPRKATTYDAHGGGRPRKQCPPHGPRLREPLADGGYVLRCLSCGALSPDRGDKGAEASGTDPDSLRQPRESGKNRRPNHYAPASERLLQ